MKLHAMLAAMPAVLCLLAPAAFAAGGAAPEANVEAQLREALRATTLQLRAAQGDLAAAQAEKEQAAAENADLAAKLDALGRRAAADRAAAEANLANLNAQLAEKDAEAARLAARLKLSEDAREDAAKLADGRAAEIASAKISRIELEREIAALRAHNRELFRIGMEVLERYENFGLGKAVAAREPFTGLARVKLQNLVQDYADRLEDERAKLPAEPAGS